VSSMTRIIARDILLGDFLAFYFNDDSYKSVVFEWECPMFGDKVTDFAEFRETAEKFGVTVSIGYKDDIVLK